MSILVVKLVTDIPFDEIVEALQDFDPYSSVFEIGSTKPLYDIEALKKAVQVIPMGDIRIAKKKNDKPWSKKSKYKNGFKKRYR